MSKYKVGDKVLIEGKINKIEYGLDFLVDVDVDGKNIIIEEDKITSKTYEDGLADAWELARKIVLSISDGGISIKDFEIIFGAGLDYKDILKIMTPQEALAKIEAYEESKAIKVGDVVKVDGTNKDCGIVIAIDEIQKKARLMYADTSFRVNEWYLADLKKTGRHIDIDGLLEQIKGGVSNS